MEDLLVCSNITKSYNKNEMALKDINLNLKAGRIVGLLGPNGSGKTTLIKIATGLLKESSGNITIQGNKIGVKTKKVVSYLPDANYLNDWMKVNDLVNYFSECYEDFNKEKAHTMLKDLQIDINKRLKTLSKGNKEKVQLILVMSRNAKLYLLDEPIGGVDPAARDYILRTIINNYNPGSTVLISTHLIADVEEILDEVIFLKNGEIILHEEKNELVGNDKEKKTVDELFREVFRC